MKRGEGTEVWWKWFDGEAGAEGRKLRLVVSLVMLAFVVGRASGVV